DVRACPREPERGAGADGGAMEVRVQERQVDRSHPPGDRPAQDVVGEGRVERVRVLLQRQPGGQPPALEPGRRAAHRRVPPAGDAAVQRLRRSGCLAVHRDGLEEILLMARIALKVLVWSACLAPLVTLGYRAWTRDLGSDRSNCRSET